LDAAALCEAGDVVNDIGNLVALYFFAADGAISMAGAGIE
jgi:ATP-dependent protease Clp ATPase subunit